MKSNDMHPGNLIRLKRKELGMTQNELAVECGINRSSIIKIENGEPILQKEWFDKIGNVIKYSPEKLRNIYQSYFKNIEYAEGKLLSDTSKEPEEDEITFLSDNLKPWSMEKKYISDFIEETSFYMKEDAKTDWVSAFINRTDNDYEIFKGYNSILSDYRNGRILIERFQLAIHLLCLALVDPKHNLSIKKIKLSSYKLDSMLDDWKSKKNDKSITNEQLIKFYKGTLKSVDKNYADYLVELVSESTKMYWLSSNALHLYEIGDIDAPQMDKMFSKELHDFNSRIRRMYVATDFIMNVLNNVSVYEIIEDAKISEYLKYQQPEDLFDFS